MVIWGEGNNSANNSDEVAHYGVFAKNIAFFSGVDASDDIDNALLLGTDMSDKPRVFSFKALLTKLKKILAEKSHKHQWEDIENAPTYKSPNLQVGTVTTGAHGTAAEVTRRAGSPDDAPIFDFVIPQGAPGATGKQGDPGARGASAYEVAVAAGFTGTEKEWLESLKIVSAYKTAVAAGYTGTEARFTAMLGMLSQLGRWPEMPFRVAGTARASNGAVSFPYAIPAFTRVSGTVMIDQQEISIVNQDRFYVPGGSAEADRTFNIDLSSAYAQSSMTFSTPLSHNYTGSVIVTLQIVVTKTGLALKCRYQYASDYTGSLETYDFTVDVSGDVTYKLAFTCP